MKKLSLKRASKHEVTLISATPINLKNNLEFSMYQANCAFDPNSKVLVPAPPKELPPPKPTNLLIEVGEQIKEFPSPSRPAPALPGLKSENELHVIEITPYLSPCKESVSSYCNNPREEKLSAGLHPVRPAPEVPLVAKEQKHVYTRSLTDPINDLKNNKKVTSLKKSSSEKQKDNSIINDCERSQKNEDVDKVEGKKNFKPPPVKPKPNKSASASNQQSAIDCNNQYNNNTDQQKPVAFIDAGDGLRSSDSESLCSEKFPLEIPLPLNEEVGDQILEMQMKERKKDDTDAISKCESINSRSSEEPCGNKVKTRPLSFPSNNSTENVKHRKSKSLSLRRKQQSPPTSPPPPPICSNLNSIAGVKSIQENFKNFADITDTDSMFDATNFPVLHQRVPIKSENCINGPRCIALCSIESKLDSDLNFNKGDVLKILYHVNNDWLYGQLKGKNGFVFKEHVNIVEDLPKYTPDPETTQQKMVARYNFIARNNKELSLHVGDIIINYKKVAHGWFYGEKLSDRGLFPISYVDFFH